MITGLKVWDRDGTVIDIAKNSNVKIIGSVTVSYSSSQLNQAEYYDYSVPAGSNRIFCIAPLPSTNDNINVIPPHVWETSTGIGWGYFSSALSSDKDKIDCTIYYGYFHL